MTSVDLDNLDNLDNLNNNECIICFDDGEHSGDTPKEVSQIPFIITQCQCKYKCHAVCLREWLSNNSRCLLCNSPIIRLPRIDEDTIHRGLRALALSAPLLTDERNIYVQNPPLPPYHIALQHSYPVSEDLNVAVDNTPEGEINEENLTLTPPDHYNEVQDDINDDVQEIENLQNNSFPKCLFSTLFIIIIFSLILKL